MTKNHDVEMIIEDDQEPTHSVPLAHCDFLEVIYRNEGIALFACSHNGNETSAIVLTEEDPKTGGTRIGPLFVGVYPGMKLVDPFGNELIIQDPVSGPDISKLN